MVRLEKSGRYAFIGDTQKSAQIWDIQTKQLHSQLIYKARQSIFSSIRFVNNGQQILTGSGTQTAILWDVDSGLAIQKWRVTPRKDTRPSTAVVYSATLWGDNQIATESSAGFLEIWPIKK
jgi:WD40 repeat protein